MTTLEKLMSLADDYAGNTSYPETRQAFEAELRKVLTPLTEEQIKDALRHMYNCEINLVLGVDQSMDKFRAIEAAHGITGDKK